MSDYIFKKLRKTRQFSVIRDYIFKKLRKSRQFRDSCVIACILFASFFMKRNHKGHHPYMKVSRDKVNVSLGIRLPHGIWLHNQGFRRDMAT